MNEDREAQVATMGWQIRIGAACKLLFLVGIAIVVSLLNATPSRAAKTITVTQGTNGAITPAGPSVSISSSSNPTFSITPASGYAVANVLTETGSVGAVTTYKFTNFNQNHTITASFGLAIPITVTPANNGTIIPGTTSVAENTDKTFTFTPNTTYAVADVIVDGVSQGTLPTYTFTNVTVPHNIAATFIKTYNITTSINTGGSISPSGVVAVNSGSNQTFTIAANSGYAIQDVKVGGVSQGAIASYTFSNVTAATSIAVTFYRPTFAITASTGVNGTVTPAGTSMVIINSNKTFAVTPTTSGYVVDTVLVDGISVGAPTSYTFSNVTANHTLSATFKIFSMFHTITASAGSDGSISPIGGVQVNQGASQTFTITPNAGQAIGAVLVDGVAQGAISTHTFTNVTTNHAIAASFVPACWTITALPGAHSTIQPTGIFGAGCGGIQQKIFVTYTSSLKDLYIQDNSVSYKILENGVYKTGSACVPTSTANKCVYTINSVGEDHSLKLLEAFNITDFPLDIQTRPAPPNIMFVLDDSGSMDWEYMTPEVGGQFNNGYYVYAPADYVGGSADNAYNETNNSKAMWQSQWSGYNKMFYSPTVDYTHWPTLTDAAVPPTATRSHPYASNTRFAKTMLLSGTFTTINSVAIPRAHYYVYSNITAKPYLVVIDYASTSIKYYQVGITGTTPRQTVSTLTLASAPPADVITSRTYNQEMQNFANWFSHYRRRSLAATMAMATVIDQLSNVYIGVRTPNYSSTYGIAKPLTPVRVLYLDANDTYVYLDQAGSLLTSLYGLDIDAYGTPLRTGLQKVGKYFDQTATHEMALPFTATSPWFPKALGGECQQAFAIAITDGYWNESPGPGIGNEDGNKGAPYQDSYSDTLADVAMYYYQNHDLVPDTILENKVPGANTKQHMTTYGVSFGVGGTLETAHPLSWYTTAPGCTSGCNYPTWPNPTTGVDDQRKIDDLWHASLNGRGSYISASDPMALVDALLTMVSDIIARDGSAASVSVNGDELYMSIGSTLRMYQTRYKSPDWTGDIISYGFNADGSVETSRPVWQAAALLDTALVNGASVGSRHVATLKNDPTGPIGIAFKSRTDLYSTQLTALDANPTTQQAIIDYVRGSNSRESATDFRVRVDRLGDIVNSTAIYIEDFIYAGANDGMLHAFNAETGQEAFAYVPNLVIPNLKYLTAQDYSGKHKFFVDNSPFAWTMGTRSTTHTPKTYLVGGLGKGGKGYYCLDITDAATITSDSELISRVKWEYPQANTPSADAIDDLGYSFSRAFLINSNAYGVTTGINPSDVDLAGYTVAFGNGYSSNSGSAVLYFLNPANGQLIKKIDVGHGPGNGLSTPVAIDINNDSRVDYYYAGDLQGNLWKFDVTDPDPAKWQVAYCDDGNDADHCLNSTSPQPLFTTRGNQPITAKADVMKHKSGKGYMVVFGTGRYLDNLDWQDISDQAIYGVWDYGDDGDDTEYLGQLNGDNTLTHQPTGVTFLPQISVFEGTVAINDLGQTISEYIRVLSKNVIDWTSVMDQNHIPAADPVSGAPYPDPAKNVGWYFNLPLVGERVTSNAMIRDGKAIITSFFLQDDRCTAGAESIVHELDPNSGGRLTSPTFDLNSDQKVGPGDYVRIGTKPDGTDNWVAPSGMKRPGRMQPPAILKIDNNTEAKYFSSSNASIQMIKEKPEKRGMYFWKQQ